MKTPKPYTFGPFIIPEPCHEPWEDMNPQDARSRLCNRCSKVVHDISGLSPSQIEALEARNGGRICATFFLHNPPLEVDPQPSVRYRLVPAWIRGAAAAAALTMFLLQPPKGYASLPISDQIHLVDLAKKRLVESGPEQTAFLLSTVILDQYEGNIVDDIVVTIHLPNGEKREVTTAAGFFHLPLEGLATEKDALVIRIEEQTFDDHSSTRKYPTTKIEVVAGQAQNVKCNLQVAYTYKHMMRGGMKRR